MSEKTFYKLPVKDKKAVLEEVSKSLRLPVASIEKDWWVVQTLRLVFEMDVGQYLVFKGGTSLSKAWKLIERLSEDVDLGLSWEFFGFPPDISRTQARTKLRKTSNEYLSHNFRDALQKSFHEHGFKDVEVMRAEEGDPDQDPVKIAVYYPQVTGQSVYIEPKVMLEIGSRSMREPFTSRALRSFVGEAFPGRDFADNTISVPCVNPERTFLEKLFLLHEEFQRPAEKVRVNRLSRHLYDIQKLAQTPFAEKALEDKALYHAIIEHRKKFSRIGSVDYEKHLPPFLNPIPPENLLEDWEKDYEKMQSEMIYETGSLPFSELIAELRKLIAYINNQ